MSEYKDMTDEVLYLNWYCLDHYLSKNGIDMSEHDFRIIKDERDTIKDEINNRIMKRQQELKDKSEQVLKKELDKLYLNIGKYVQTGNEDSFDAEAMRWQARAIEEELRERKKRPDAKNKIGINIVGVTADNGDLVTDDNRIIDFTDNAVRFEDNLAKMLEIYKKKNKDYGNSTHKTYEKYGYVSYLTRIDDKLNRLENLLKSGATPEVEESISDTLIDLANYFIIFKMELEDESKD
jgi:hypothetical protein